MTSLLWAGFLAFILLMLFLDLCVLNRRAHVVRVREAIAWTCVCIVLALAFNVLVYFLYENHWLGVGLGQDPPLEGREAAQQFFAGWLIEYSLSLDNIFVIALIFQYFRVPETFQHRVLFWGILGALVMRGGMILAGAALIRYFSWTEYLFGAVLLYSAYKMLMSGGSDPEPERGWVVRSARRIFRISPAYEGEKFFTRVDSRFAITPLFLVLLVVETTDVIFAVDSIPAIFAITQDPFIVFTSNVFAILGLRSLYFALAAIIDKFRYLKTSLVVVLAFVGVKMLIGDLYHIPTAASLITIVAILSVGLVASAFASRRERLRRSPPIVDIADAADIAWRRARRIVILVLGLTIVFIIAPLVGLIPGPAGIPVALAGLALLATEFIWARKLLNQLKSRAQALAAKADAAIGSNPKLWPVPLVLLAFALAVAGLLWWGRHHWSLIAMGAAGPTIAICYWATVTVRRWLASRPSGAPIRDNPADMPAEAGPGPQGQT